MNYENERKKDGKIVKRKNKDENKKETLLRKITRNDKQRNGMKKRLEEQAKGRNVNTIKRVLHKVG